ncbi:uncharacterized protein KY384_004816 [Bacidia gigantensis]|uniref:uncharacterized protein n=1 Tax=Bacidia gigantensis TaxID=2732470 RepID=UPI001D042791|nr:uncharacterized protein KY384_004816 [Bacidia gigantensis]KAG8530314.1 hypothetical protein KY384_004816 [Bacidia gigantensis]
MNHEENAALRQKFELLKGAEQHKNALIEERDAFVLVLIDGDGMIFNEQLMAKGEAGGKEAAGLLWNAVATDVNRRIPDLGIDYKIVTRIYANLKGLADVCHRAGMLDYPSLLEDFARGFTGSKQLFDFVDVGTGKDRADDKISEDVAETSIMNSITLLEGVPFERELEQLKSLYSATKFDGLFRTEKINIYNTQNRETQRPAATAPPQSNGLHQPPQYQSTYQSSLPPIQQQPSQTHQIQPQLRTTSSSSASSAPLNAAAPTWASAAMKPALASPPLTPQPAKSVIPQVPRNRLGQRVDPVGTYDPQEVKRIKSKKMCNVHFLRNDCPYDPCTHDHYFQPTKNELATLRYVSRMTPCKFGLECDDLKCIYGHRCPVDREGSKECKFGENCRFELESHGIDRRIVNVVKVGGK